MFTNTEAPRYDRQSILVYGKSGTGKTRLSKTLPTKKVLIINAENGLKTLKGSNLEVYDITVDRDGNKLDRKFRFEKLIHLLHLLNDDEYKKKYDWLVFDSLTEITQCLVEFLKNKYPDKKDALVLWGEYTDMVLDFVKKLRDFAPYNVLLLALESVEKDESGRRFIGVDINGTKAAMRLPALFDDVFHLRTFVDQDGNERRFLITSEYESNIAKHRTDRPGDLEKFEEANLTTILNKMSNIQPKEKLNGTNV